VPHNALPVATVALVLPFGVRDDPADRPGLAGVLTDLMEEGGNGLDAIAMAEALAGLGTEVSIDVGADATTVSCSVLARCFEPAMALLFGLIARPHLAEDDFARVVELRVNRLAQLRSSASAMADRLLLRGVVGNHPYGHGALGTIASLESLTLDEVRRFHRQHVTPSGTICVVSGAVPVDEVQAVIERHADIWVAAPGASRVRVESPTTQAPRTLVSDRPGSPQSEVRIGWIGPDRSVAEYHTLVTLNAMLGGQFTSRINRNLRERRGLTYGAHSSFDFRACGGVFSCDTAVQADATVLAITELLNECRAIATDRPPDAEELALAKASLTRGYVRLFETSGHLAQAAARLAMFGLPDDTFERFVPAVDAVTGDMVVEAARRYLAVDQACVAAVGDVAQWRAPLEALGRPLDVVEEP
jgi:zinc protease